MSFEKTLVEQTKVQLKRSWKMPITYVLGAVLLALFAPTASGDVHLYLNGKSQSYAFGDITTPGTPILRVLFVLVTLTAAWSLSCTTTRHTPIRWLPSLLVALTGIETVFDFLVYAGNGSNGVVTLASLLVSAIAISTSLVFGSPSGVVSEHVDVVSIATGGNLFVGALTGVMATSFFQTLYAGITTASFAGALLGPLLALFSVKYEVDQIIVDVVLNVLALGLTTLFYGTLMEVSPQTLNTNQFSLTPIKIPPLIEVPAIGPMLFNQALLVHLIYLAVAFFAMFLHRSRWSLYLRACGEHPKAADTIGINMNHTRGRNAILASSFAGLDGAFFTIGSGLAFTDGISAGNGYIALAAMIPGKWHPLGATSAALMFGFAQVVARVLPNVSPAIPSDLVSMIPYLVAIVTVAGFVGKLRAPAAENIPYVK